MIGIVEHEIFRVRWGTRVESLRENVPRWIESLSKDERLVIGILAASKEWERDTVIPNFALPGDVSAFLAWLDASSQAIEGTEAMSKPETQFVLCIVRSPEFDIEAIISPRLEFPLRCTLHAYRSLMQDVAVAA